MEHTTEVLHRRSIRLQSYDYTGAGAYFVTLCSQGLICRFGAVVDGAVRLNTCGVIVSEEWARTQLVRPNVTLDAFVVMPNHLHGIIILHDGGAWSHSVQRTFGRSISGSLGSVIGHFKAAVTRRISSRTCSADAMAWQRNYYERIIRSEAELNLARRYIDDNPAHWRADRHNRVVQA